MRSEDRPDDKATEDPRRQLKARNKGKSDEEIMDMAKEQLGLKKRRNPPFKNAKEALKDALKRMTTIELVEYEPYEPPGPEPMVEQSIESLERTAKGVVKEEEGVEEGGKAEDLTTQTVKDDWTVMFDKERKEHPTLPEEVVKRIVDDHMYIIRRLSFLDSKTGGDMHVASASLPTRQKRSRSWHPPPWTCAQCGMPNPSFEFVCKSCGRGVRPHDKK